jgi:hypothetical protein
VLKATKTEREFALERDLREREIRIAELEDERERLKALARPTLNTPPPHSAAPEKQSWLHGLTFFED